ncbi:hypothetical protein SASPL_147080 [Salvia splendens]|uniref:Myb-like domain-containing protein n=1 Tax=Salvia splendens TaxID=180675 RepID=A0A8X8Z6A9_SALSN|nr:hypothetical protein SASPL_147080 [Salvia splendens]
MVRQPCCDKIGLKRGLWTIKEDHKLMTFILNNGIQCWRTVPKFVVQNRLTLFGAKGRRDQKSPEHQDQEC